MTIRMAADGRGGGEDPGMGVTLRGFAEGQQVFNRYRLERILGRGGMGVVWLAFDEELERRVALKFVPELVCLDKEAIADLKRETRRSLEITHPNIVRIYDFHQDVHTAAISMEYIDGTTLSALKIERKGCVDAGELQPILKQLCEALDYAHGRAKVVHRDLKPANLMLNRGGELKITDFGISCSISDSVSRVSLARGTSGTVVFMSPQQALGERPTPADDIYAVGATIYDLVAGKPPFYRGDVMTQLRESAPAPMAARREELGLKGGPIPESWERTVAACLAKDPAARPGSAGEVFKRLSAAGSAAVGGQVEVAGVTGVSTVPAVPAGAARGGEEAAARGEGRGRWMGPLAFLVCVVPVMGVGWFLWSRAASPVGARPGAALEAKAGDKEAPAAAPPAAPVRDAGLFSPAPPMPASDFSLVPPRESTSLIWQAASPVGARPGAALEAKAGDKEAPAAAPPAAPVRDAGLFSPVPPVPVPVFPQVPPPELNSSMPPFAGKESTLEERAAGGDAQAQYQLGKALWDGIGRTRDAAQARKWFAESAERGCAAAQTQLGWIYGEGFGVPADLAKAQALYRAAAAQGDGAAQNNLGVMYGSGAGVVKDDVAAVEWYRKAVASGYPLAMSNLGSMYAKGTGVTRDYAKALELFQKGVEAGDAEARSNLGSMYENGYGVGKDFARAVELYQAAADGGSISACCNLGAMYEAGKGVKKDEARAAELYQKAAEAGLPRAYHNLSVLYDGGRGVPKDPAKSAELCRKAAEAGLMEAQYNLGWKYLNGVGVAQDSGKAEEWFRRAADAGMAMAQYNIGVMYGEGRGLRQDDAQAVAWYRKAAEGGLADAQSNLGYMYVFGRGVPKSVKTGVAWYERAAEQGYVIAMANLGDLFENGTGGTRDYAKAAEWYRKAGEHGHSQAMARLAVLYESGKGVPKSRAKMMECLEKAAKMGNKDAQKILQAMKR